MTTGTSHRISNVARVGASPERGKFSSPSAPESPPEQPGDRLRARSVRIRSGPYHPELLADAAVVDLGLLLRRTDRAGRLEQILGKAVAGDGLEADQLAAELIHLAAAAWRRAPALGRACSRRRSLSGRRSRRRRRLPRPRAMRPSS